MLFYIIRKQCPLLIALLFSAIGGMWLLGIGFYLYPIFPCMLLSLIGSYLVTRANEGPAAPEIVSAGACTGLTALFRYDIGFFLLTAHLSSIAVLIALSEPRETRVRRAADDGGNVWRGYGRRVHTSSNRLPQRLSNRSFFHRHRRIPHEILCSHARGYRFQTCSPLGPPPSICRFSPRGWRYQS